MVTDWDRCLEICREFIALEGKAWETGSVIMEAVWPEDDGRFGRLVYRCDHGDGLHRYGFRFPIVYHPVYEPDLAPDDLAWRYLIDISEPHGLDFHPAPDDRGVRWWGAV
ncbi:MAG: hypothetical protein QG597_3088 [Actinomycetota bacterium]|nr:hypothetical protein [Actinomycetota bacterium]